MDLVDSLSSNTHSHSVVELSLNTCFRRGYSSLFKAIADYQPEEAKKNLAKLAAPYLSEPVQRPFWLLGVDVTPVSRPYALRIEDRGYVYQPNPIRSNKPITIGHQFSDVFALPERTRPAGAVHTPAKLNNRVIPLSTERVKSRDDKEMVGAKQIRTLLEDEEMPFHNRLCAEVMDSSYSKPAYLEANRDNSKLVTIVRVRSNRIFYRQPGSSDHYEKRGHPTWYGKSFSLKDTHTWSSPDEKVTTAFTSYRGRVYRVEIQAWFDLLMRGERKPTLLLMQDYPFTLVRICLYNGQGEMAYQNPMWLIVMGEERRKLSLIDVYEAYKQRYDIEHFFRFGKQRMLLTHYQTPEVEHEGKWWYLVHLAYLQLWVARQYANNLPHPWERYLRVMKDKCPSPAMVQRDFGRIIRLFGTPSGIPKQRGKSAGRRKGAVLAVRARQPVVFKHQI